MQKLVGASERSHPYTGETTAPHVYRRKASSHPFKEGNGPTRIQEESQLTVVKGGKVKPTRIQEKPAPTCLRKEAVPPSYGRKDSSLPITGRKQALPYTEKTASYDSTKDA